jgi:carbamoyltransferase
MGLAPYASEYQKKRPREVFDKSLTVDGLDFIRDPEMKDYFQYFKCRLEGCRFDGIAGGLQDFVEDRMSTWFNNISIETNINKFCYAGGVSNNIKANKSISEKYFIDDFFVPAGPSDENLSIGAAYMAYEQEQEQNMKHIANNITQYDAYFGCDIESEDIKNFKKNKYVKDNYRHKECSIEFSEIAEILSKGEIIAVCSGRMEFGSRALGHRSLIADPSNPSTLKNINELIKKRDFWMPFTPSIIDHQYDNYVINNKDLHTSFMTMSFDTTKKGGEHLISAIHPYDQTVRPQKVTRDTSPEYYKIINALYDLTGVGAVLNTSLNIHGKPIVMKPVDIVNEILLEGVPLNYILVNNILFTRI